MPYAGMAELADALGFGSSGEPCGVDSHYPYHVGAKFALLRRFLCPRQKDVICSLPCAPLQIAPHCAGLRFDSGASRYFFVHKKVRFNRPFQKKDMTKKSCLSFGVSAALRPPPLGISMLGRAKPSLRNSSVLRTCELTAHQRHRPEGRR